MNCRGHYVCRSGSFPSKWCLLRTATLFPGTMAEQHGCGSFMCLSCCFSLYSLGQRLSLPGRALISSVYSGAEYQLHKQRTSMHFSVFPFFKGSELSTQASKLRHYCSYLQHTIRRKQPGRPYLWTWESKRKCYDCKHATFLGTVAWVFEQTPEEMTLNLTNQGKFMHNRYTCPH